MLENVLWKRYSTIHNEIVYQGVKFLHNSDFKDYYDVNPSWLIAYAGGGWQKEEAGNVFWNVTLFENVGVR